MKQNTPADLPAVGAHFLEFVIQFFTLTKIQYQQQNQIKANTQGFQLLFLLNHQEEASLTMSELAAQMHTTKQQLTRLVNALEEKSRQAEPRHKKPASCICFHHAGGDRCHGAAKGVHAGGHQGGAFLLYPRGACAAFPVPGHALFTDAQIQS